jgi:UDP-N-acetyl-D-glucosamine dehydrogenase
VNELKRVLLEKIATGSCHVGVIGLGYAGLPLALAFVERAQLKVTGFELDAAKVQALAAGRSYLRHVPSERIARARATGRFDATTDLDELARPDALLIAVPTPLDAARAPELEHVVSSGRAIAERLRRGQLIVLESTTYPGTTDGLLRELLERSGLTSGRDFFLAYSPEREDPGNRDFSTTTIPKLVGGVDADSGDVAAALYARVLDHVVHVATARVAEAAKLAENVFRSVNIALVNELKVVFDGMGIDVWQVLDAAATKPFGFMRFEPGPGPGGHCIPIDPLYLAWSAREAGARARLVELADEIHAGMPQYVLQKLEHALNARQRTLAGSKILLLGIAYKKDSDDPRESPALTLLTLLHERGALIAYHDPHVPVAPRLACRAELPPLKSQPLTSELLQTHDAVLLCTDHTDLDTALALTYARVIVDTRGVYREPHPKVVKA